MLGDGVCFHFRDPRDAVLASLEIVRSVGPRGLPPAHIGVNAGPVIYDEGDYFGRTVNIAARIASEAGPEEVLVGEAVLATGGSDGVSFESEARPISRASPTRFRCTAPSRRKVSAEAEFPPFTGPSPVRHRLPVSHARSAGEPDASGGWRATTTRPRLAPGDRGLPAAAVPLRARCSIRSRTSTCTRPRRARHCSGR